MTAKELAQRLEARKTGEGWKARCPAHDDKTPSLAIKEGQGGRVLLRCWAGCELGNICEALGIKIKDLFERDLFDDMNEDQFVALCKGTFKAKVVGEEKAAVVPTATVATPPTPVKLEPLLPEQADGIAKWRGYSKELVEWLNSSGLIGHYEGQVAFPVANGVHFRKKDGTGWRYMPAGVAKPELFVLGGIEEGAPIHCFESQWDALAYADASGERTNIVATRGASNVKLLADKLRGHSGTLYLWPQNDAPGAEWLERIRKAMPDQQLKRVEINVNVFAEGQGDPRYQGPLVRKIKDLNEWRKSGATSDDVFNAYRDAKDFGEVDSEKQEPKQLMPASAEAIPEKDFPAPVLAEPSSSMVEHLKEKVLVSMTNDGEARESTPAKSSIARKTDSRGGENISASSDEASQPSISATESAEPPQHEPVQVMQTDAVERVDTSGNSVASGKQAHESHSTTPAPLALSFPSLSQEYASGPPPCPAGPPVKSLPSISNAAGGLFGLWVVMGEPGVGKSALARQIACSAGRHYAAILDYDYENGPGVIVSRLAAALGDGDAGWRYATKNWYTRPSITSLEKDIKELNGHKAMVIVDSFQSLPASTEFQTESMSKWMQYFERLARDGHFVMIISEKNRANYGQSGLAAGKGTGAIEYKAWFGLNLIGQAGDDGSSPIECHVFKNRHRAQRGRVCWLERNDSGFWFVEWSHGVTPDE